MIRIYLAHSAHEKEQGKEIQFQLEAMGYDVYNPFDKEGNDEVFWNENNEVIWDGIPTKESSLWIIFTDLDAVSERDILVCIFPQDLVTFGITCEMIFPFILKNIHRWLPMYNTNGNIKVYSYTPKSIKGHPWIVGSSDIIFTDIEKLLEYLKEKYPAE